MWCKSKLLAVICLCFAAITLPKPLFSSDLSLAEKHLMQNETDPCLPPCGLTVLTVSATNAALIWCAPLNVSTFKVVIEDVNGTIVDSATVTGTSYTTTNLAPNTDYNAKVSSLCDPTQPPTATSTLSAAFRTFIIIEGVVMLQTPPSAPLTTITANAIKTLSFSWPPSQNCKQLVFTLYNPSNVISGQFVFEICKSPYTTTLRKVNPYIAMVSITPPSTITISPWANVTFSEIDTNGKVKVTTTGMPVGYYFQVSVVP